MRRLPWLFLALGCSGGTPSPVPPGSPALVFPSGTLWVELARTPQERARGLMFRESLAPDSGMLFIFETEGRHPFWMKNTPLPLSIAFLSRDMRVVDLLELQPYDETPRAPKSPALYAVEANRGWFREHGIGLGDTARLVYIRKR